MDDYVPPPIFIKDGKNLQNDFDVALNNLVATFPRGKYNPDVSSNFVSTQTYGQEYVAAQKIMLDLQEDFFLYKNSIVKNNQQIINDMNSLDTKINDLDIEIKTLKDQLDSLKGSSYSAEGMLDDSKLTRNQLLISNIILFLLISIFGTIYYKRFVKNAP